MLWKSQCFSLELSRAKQLGVRHEKVYDMSTSRFCNVCEMMSVAEFVNRYRLENVLGMKDRNKM